MDENKILFVDLDGTLIKEDLSNLAFIYCLKKKPFKLIYYLIISICKNELRIAFNSKYRPTKELGGGHEDRRFQLRRHHQSRFQPFRNRPSD